MPLSSIKFNRGLLRRAVEDFRTAIEKSAEVGMDRAMKMAQHDAAGTAHWREANTYTQEYPSGEWTWTVTGMARSSITAYVVPGRGLRHFPDYWTTSYRNGMPLQHKHSFDDSIASTPTPQEGKVIGIITMNVAYAPYLQDYERSIGVQPITVEVLAMNWVPVYVPLIQGVMHAEMARVAKRYT